MEFLVPKFEELFLDGHAWKTPQKNDVLKWMDVWYFGEFPTIFPCKDLENHHPIETTYH